MSETLSPPHPPSSKIKLFNISSSRSVRIAWLLEELEVDYEVITFERLPNFDVPPEFRKTVGGMGRVPTIHDGEIIVQESGAITEYLCAKHPSANPSEPLLPTAPPAVHAKVLEYIHAAEGTFCFHAAPLLYVRRAMPADPSRLNDSMFTSIEDRVVRKVRQDLAWLEGELKAQKERMEEGDQALFLVGKHLTVADIMMGFSIGFVLERVTREDENGERYRTIEQWMVGMRKRKTLMRAMQKVDFK